MDLSTRIRPFLYKTPIADGARRYLQQASPHRSSHFRFLLMILVIASIPWWYRFEPNVNNTNANNILLVMAIPILSAYWIFQFEIMRSAVYLARYDRIFAAPDILLRTISTDTASFAQLRAVIRYHWVFIIGISIALLSLSLAITTDLYYFFENGRGILKYVGVVTSGYYLPNLAVPTFPYLRWPSTILLAAVLLLGLTFTNSLLSVCIGLWAGHLRQAFMSRLRLLVIVFAIFLGLYALRETPTLQCDRRMLPYNCDSMLFQMRLTDSFQAMSLTFEDGGAAMVTGVHLPNGISQDWEGYQWRYLFVSVATILAQFALSSIYLWRTNINNRRKRVIWLFGIYDGEYYLWRYRWNQNGADHPMSSLPRQIR